MAKDKLDTEEGGSEVETQQPPREQMFTGLGLVILVTAILLSMLSGYWIEKVLSKNSGKGENESGIRDPNSTPKTVDLGTIKVQILNHQELVSFTANFQLELHHSKGEKEKKLLEDRKAELRSKVSALMENKDFDEAKVKGARKALENEVRKMINLQFGSDDILQQVWIDRYFLE